MNIERNKKMKNITKTIKSLIEQDELEIAVDRLVDDSKNIEQLVLSYIWSKQRLQQLILNKSVETFMHWNSSYDLIANVENINADWFYRDEEGSFYNVNSDHSNELLIRIELMTQSE